MTTVAQRLSEAHEPLLKLYSSIPVLTPCLERIKSNQAEFVVLNARLRQLQESILAGQHKVDKARRQLDSVFTINKVESEKAYHQELDDLKAIENERRICLRQRDSVVTVRYQLHKQRVVLLEETRQLKKLTESVFDRSKDEVANADFPEELHWQLELKEYDIKISEVRRQCSKYNTALSNLARAANLSEAALVAFLGYPDAAYKVWKVEYALKDSQKMRLYLRVELSLSNAYSNEDAAREACPNIIPSLTVPIKPSSVQGYFESTRKKPIVQPFDAEHQLRTYIAHLRSAHRTAETLLAQETERLNAMQAYRESIIPLLAKIRRHVFQNSCLGGYKIEGWENEQGQSLLGTEADILVRGGIHEAGMPTLTRPALSTSSSQATPTLPRDGDIMDDEEEIMNTRARDRLRHASVPDVDDQETSIDPSRPVVVHGGRVVISAGRAPLSTLAPANVLGSEVLMQVDRERQARQAKINSKAIKSRHKARSRSRSGRDMDIGARPGADNQQAQESNGFSALGSLIMNNSENALSSSQGEREDRKKTSRGLFGFARSRRGSNSGVDDAVVPTGAPTPSSRFFQLASRSSLSSVDVSSSSAANRGGISSGGSHSRNLPSISISNHGDGNVAHHPLRRSFFENASLVQLPTWSTQPAAGSSTPSSTTPPLLSSSSTGPRVMTMDEYIGIGPVAERNDNHVGPFDPSQGSEPLIPSYEEHQQHMAVDPELLHMMNSSVTYDGLSSLTERDEGVQDGFFMTQDVVQEEQGGNSHVLSGHHNVHENSGSNSRSGAGPSVIRTGGQHHSYSLSDQTPDGSSLTRGVPPPDYAAMPPEYTA
ncbi:hypothetical protein EDD21DRAFT_373817 [Dissophora ornata]|nr:hypothetical protein EDD21DRAFT_373817 [Dissophora ornata]